MESFINSMEDNRDLVHAMWQGLIKRRDHREGLVDEILGRLKKQWVGKWNKSDARGIIEEYLDSLEPHDDYIKARMIPSRKVLEGRGE